MDEYKKMFESVEKDLGDGSGKIPMIKLYSIMSTMPEFDNFDIKDLLKALIKIDKHSVDSIEDSFECVEDWLFKINFEKFLELIEKSLIVIYWKYVRYSHLGYFKIENGMILVYKLFPFIAKDGNRVSMAEFDQFMKKAQSTYQVYKDAPQDFPPYKEKDINEVFQSLDLDKDGKLSVEEMMIGLTNELFRKFSVNYLNGIQVEDSD